MKINKVQMFNMIVENMLRKSISDDYVNDITMKILPDVIDDVECCADEDYNEDDIKLAIGRVLCDKMGIER